MCFSKMLVVFIYSLYLKGFRMVRLVYLVVTIVTLLVGSFSLSFIRALERVDNAGTSSSVFVLIFFVSYIVYIVATFYRFKNAGINPWWALTGFIPLVTIGTWLVALFSKPKQAVINNKISN